MEACHHQRLLHASSRKHVQARSGLDRKELNMVGVVLFATCQESQNYNIIVDALETYYGVSPNENGMFQHFNQNPGTGFWVHTAT